MRSIFFSALIVLLAVVAAQDCTVGQTRTSVYGVLFPRFADQFETTPQPWPTTGVCQEPSGTQCCKPALLTAISIEADTIKANIDTDISTTRNALKQTRTLFNKNFIDLYKQAIDQLSGKEKKAVENFVNNLVALMDWLASDDVIPSRMEKCYYAMLTHRIGAMCMICDSRFTSFVTDANNDIVFKFAQSTCDYVAPRCAPFFRVYIEFLKQLGKLMVEFFKDLGQPNNFDNSITSALSNLPCGGTEQACADTVCKVLLIGLAAEFQSRSDGLVNPALGLFGTSKRSLPSAVHPIIDTVMDAVKHVSTIHNDAHTSMAKRSVENDANEFSASGYATTDVGTSSSKYPGDPAVRGSSTAPSSAATVVFMLLVQIICVAMLF